MVVKDVLQCIGNRLDQVGSFYNSRSCPLGDPRGFSPGILSQVITSCSLAGLFSGPLVFVRTLKLVVSGELGY
jgi:hypothetical protein